MKRMQKVRETVGRGREEERQGDRLVHFVLRGYDGSELNNQGVMKIINGDCLVEMKKLTDKSVDLTVTSPPYDNLRTYNGNITLWGEHVWKGVLSEIFRVTKQGGLVVWVVSDETKE